MLALSQLFNYSLCSIVRVSAYYVLLRDQSLSMLLHCNVIVNLMLGAHVTSLNNNWVSTKLQLSLRVNC